MRSSVLSLALAPWLAIAVPAQTTKSGTITSSETWSGDIDIVGDVMLADGVTVDVLPGTTITFRSDNAVIAIPQTDADAELRLRGTAENRITVTTAAGVVPGRIGAYGTFYATGIRAEYTDFSNLGGSGTDYAIYHAPRDPGDHLIVRHCTFSGCYTVFGNAYGSAAHVELASNDFRSGTDAALKILATSGDLAQHIVRDNTSDGDFEIYGFRTHVSDNVLYGVDVQMLVQVASDQSLIERNYVHNPIGDGPGSGIAMPINQDDVVVRNNFVSGGQQSLSLKLALRAQVHDNVLQSVTAQHEHATGLPTDGLFARNVLIGEPVYGCLITSSPPVNGVTVKNNVIHGRDQPGLWLNHIVAAVGIADVRNNVFYDCANPVRGAVFDESGVPDSLLSIDYNCFYSTNANPENYHGSIRLTGKTERVTVGFGHHDLTPGGATNQQVDPQFVNPVVATSVTPAQMMSRSRRIDAILYEVRSGYSYRPGSPCIDAGDPRDDGDPDVLDGRRDIGLEQRSRGEGALVRWDGLLVRWFRSLRWIP